MEKNFFNEQTSSSRIKANIVAEYFPQYCKILLKRHKGKIIYLDLFSGPGRYNDNNLSTPLLITKACAEDPELANSVHLMFNDNQYIDDLKNAFYEIFPAVQFKHEPRFGNKTVGEDERIKAFLSKEPDNSNSTPTLLFFDPWGYKGIDTLILSKFLSNWGNELFLFVNIKRIHAAVENNKFDELMKSLFPTSIDDIRKNRKYQSTVYDRLNLIMDNLAAEFRKAVGDNLFHCSFKFQEEDSEATSHFIIHFTKHKRGYELVKQVYYDFDNIGATLENDGNYTFDAKRMGDNSTLDFGDQNVAILSNLLYNNYKGSTISARQLFEEHNTNTKWCGSHYTKTLREMERKGLLRSTFNDSVQHKVSVLLTNNCILQFN